MSKKDRIQKEKIDDEYDFDDGLDMEEFSFDATEPVDDRHPATKAVGGFVDGFTTGAFDTQFLKNQLKDTLPEGYGQTLDMSDRLSDTLSNTYDESLKAAKPAVKEFKRQMLKIIPRDSKYTPDFVKDLLGEWSDEAKAEQQQNTEVMRDDFLNMQLGSVFTAQLQQSDQMRREDTERDAIGEAVETQRHQQSMAISAESAQAVSRIDQYLRTINLEWQKKDLEVQYRQLFALQDILKITQETGKVQIQELPLITKNTGLPDFVKQTSKEFLVEYNKRRMAEAIGKGLFGSASEYMERGLTNLSKNVVKKVSSVAGNARDAFMQVGSVLGDDGMGVDKAELVGSIGGSMAAETLAEKFFGWLRTNVVPKSEYLKKGDEKLRDAVRNLPRKVADTQREWASEVDDGGLISSFKKLVASSFGKQIQEQDVGVMDYNKIQAPHDRTSKTINEIIPTYLAEMLAVLTDIYRQGGASGGAASNTPPGEIEGPASPFGSSRKTRDDLLVWDYQKDRLVRRGELQGQLEKKIVTDGGVRSLDEITKALIKAIGAQDKTEEFQQTLREGLLRASANNMVGNKENLTKRGVFKGKYADKSTKLMEDFFTKIEFDNKKREEFETLFNKAVESLHNPRPEVMKMVDMGYAPMLKDMGVLNADNNFSSHQVLDKYMERLAQAEVIEVDKKKKKKTDESATSSVEQSTPAPQAEPSRIDRVIGSGLNAASAVVDKYKGKGKKLAAAFDKLYKDPQQALADVAAKHIYEQVQQLNALDPDQDKEKIKKLYAQIEERIAKLDKNSKLRKALEEAKLNGSVTSTSSITSTEVQDTRDAGEHLSAFKNELLDIVSDGYEAAKNELEEQKTKVTTAIQDTIDTLRGVDYAGEGRAVANELREAASDAGSAIGDGGAYIRDALIDAAGKAKDAATNFSVRGSFENIKAMPAEFAKWWNKATKESRGGGGGSSTSNDSEGAPPAPAPAESSIGSGTVNDELVINESGEGMLNAGTPEQLNADVTNMRNIERRHAEQSGAPRLEDTPQAGDDRQPRQFAKGGVFSDALAQTDTGAQTLSDLSNQVHWSEKTFSFVEDGLRKLGVLGEAGKEAVMPASGGGVQAVDDKGNDAGKLPLVRDQTGRLSVEVDAATGAAPETEEVSEKKRSLISSIIDVVSDGFNQIKQQGEKLHLELTKPDSDKAITPDPVITSDERARRLEQGGEVDERLLSMQPYYERRKISEQTDRDVFETDDAGRVLLRISEEIADIHEEIRDSERLGVTAQGVDDFVKEVRKRLYIVEGATDTPEQQVQHAQQLLTQLKRYKDASEGGRGETTQDTLARHADTIYQIGKGFYQQLTADAVDEVGSVESPHGEYDQERSLLAKSRDILDKFEIELTGAKAPSDIEQLYFDAKAKIAGLTEKTLSSAQPHLNAIQDQFVESKKQIDPYVDGVIERARGYNESVVQALEQSRRDNETQKLGFIQSLQNNAQAAANAIREQVRQNSSKQEVASEAPAAPEQPGAWSRVTDTVSNAVTGIKDTLSNTFTRDDSVLGKILEHVASLDDHVSVMVEGKGSKWYNPLSWGMGRNVREKAREIREKTKKAKQAAVNFGGGVAGAVGGLASLGTRAITGTIGGAFSAAGWLGKKNIEGISWAGKKAIDYYNAPLDVYVQGENRPRLIAIGFENQAYFKQKSSKPVKDHNDVDDVIVDKEGRTLIAADELDKLYTKGIGGRAKRLTKGLAKIAGKGIMGLANAFIGSAKLVPMTTKFAWDVVSGTAKLGKKLYQSIGDGPSDVYTPGSAEPVMTASVMKRGGYISKVSKRPILRPTDIDGPVLDLEGREVLSSDQFAKGVFNVQGKEFKTATGKLFGAVGGLARGIAKTQGMAWELTKKISSSMLSGMGNLGKWALGGFSIEINGRRQREVLEEIRDFMLVKWGKGLKPKDAKKLGELKPAALEKMKELEDKQTIEQKAKKAKKKKTRAEESVIEGQAHVVEQIQSVIAHDTEKKEKENAKTDLDGDGDRDGSARDIQDKKRKEDEVDARARADEKNKLLTQNEQALKEKGKPKKGIFDSLTDAFSKLKETVLGVIGSFGFLKKLGALLGMGGAAAGAAGALGAGGAAAGAAGAIGAGTVAAGAAGAAGAAAKTGLLGKAAGIGAKLAPAAKFLRFIPGLGMAAGLATAGMAAWGASKDMLGMSDPNEKPSEKSSLLGTIGETAMWVLPLVSMPLAIGAGAAYLGYKAYKYFSKAKVTQLDKLRYVQYGFHPSDKDNFAKVRALEDYCKGFVKHKDGFSIDEKSMVLKEFLGTFDISETNSNAMSLFFNWYQKRFKPIYFKHIGALQAITNKRGEIDLGHVPDLKDDDALQYHKLTRFDDGPYSYNTPGENDAFCGGSTVRMVYDEVGKELAKSGKDTGKLKNKYGEEAKINQDSAITPGQYTPNEVLAKGEAGQALHGLNKDGSKATALSANMASVSAIDRSLVRDEVIGDETVVKQLADLSDAKQNSFMGALDVIRFKAYGLRDMDKGKIKSIKALIEVVNKDVKVAGAEAAWSGSALKTLLALQSEFGVIANDPKPAQNWVEWFLKRFLPVHLKWVSLYCAYTRAREPSDNLTLLKVSQQYEIGKQLISMPIWDEKTPPWVGYDINTNASSTRENLTFLEDLVQKEVAIEQKAAKEGKIKPKPKTEEDDKYSQREMEDYLKQRDEKALTSPDAEPRPNARATSTPDKAGSNASGLKMADGPVLDGANGASRISKAGNVKLDGVNPALLAQFYGMADEYYQLTGNKLIVTDGYRSYEDQVRMKQKYPDKAAEPGKSLHGFGLAMDVDSKGLDKADSLGLMRKYGFIRPLGGEPWHMEPIGTQFNIEKYKRNPDEAMRAIKEGLGRGGGGYATVTGAPNLARNDALAKSIWEASVSPNVKLEGIAGRDVDKRTTQASTPESAAPKSIQSPSDGKLKPAPVEDNQFAKLQTKLMDTSGGVKPADAEPKPNVALAGNTGSLKDELPARDPKKLVHRDQEDFGAGVKVKAPMSGDKKEVAETVKQAAQAVGVDPKTAVSVVAVESGFNPQAKSSGSSASGLYQFIESTWNAELRKNGAKYGFYPGQTSPFDAKANAIIGAHYLKSNTDYLEKKGDNNVDAADLYMAHFLGPAGAAKFNQALRENPDQPAASVLPKAAGSNPSIFYDRLRARSLSEVRKLLEDKVKNKAAEHGVQANISLTPPAGPPAKLGGDKAMLKAQPSSASEPSGGKSQSPSPAASSPTMPKSPGSVNVWADKQFDVPDGVDIGLPANNSVVKPPASSEVAVSAPAPVVDRRPSPAELAQQDNIATASANDYSRYLKPLEKLGSAQLNELKAIHDTLKEIKKGINDKSVQNPVEKKEESSQSVRPNQTDHEDLKRRIAGQFTQPQSMPKLPVSMARKL